MRCQLDAVSETLTAPTSRQSVSRMRAGVWSQVEDELAEEVAVALEYNGVSHAVMMATPADLEEFALGFSLSEGILERADELSGVESEVSALGVTLQLNVSSAASRRTTGWASPAAPATRCCAPR